MMFNTLGKRLLVHAGSIVIATGSCVVAAAPEGVADLPGVLQAFASSSERELTLPPGVYHLPKEGVMMRKWKDKVLHAKGVTFVGTDLRSRALQFHQCANMVVEGLVVDYDPLPFTQGRIIAMDPSARTADFQISAGYPELSDVYLERKNVHLFEPSAPRWKDSAPDLYPRQIERLGPRTGRLIFSDKSSAMKAIAVGDRIVLNVRETEAVLIGEGCAGLTFKDVTVHAAPGIGILIRFAEEAGTFENVRVAPGPKPAGAEEERLFSTSADAFNAAYVRKGPVMKGCDFSYMGDDGVNLHGVMLPVIKWLDEHTFASMRSHRGDRFDRLIRAGDEIRFLKAPDYAITARAKVMKVDYASGPDAPYQTDARTLWPALKDFGKAAFYTVHLDQAVRGVAAGDFCDVPATSAPGFSITDCSFHDHRARGLRLMSNDGVVEGNRFKRLKGVAITVGPEYAFWQEAGWCRNIAIRDNEILSAGLGGNLRDRTSYTTGAITVMGRVEALKEKTRFFPGNEKIIITGNTIHGCSVNGITVCGAKDVVVSHNKLSRVNQSQSTDTGADYGLNQSTPISVHQAEAVVEANQIEP